MPVGGSPLLCLLKQHPDSIFLFPHTGNFSISLPWLFGLPKKREVVYRDIAPSNLPILRGLVHFRPYFMGYKRSADSYVLLVPPSPN